MALRTLMLSLVIFQGWGSIWASSLIGKPNDSNGKEIYSIPCENTFVTTDGSTILCKDGQSDWLSFNNTGSEPIGTSYTYFLTNSSGDILQQITGSIFDFDVLATGDYEIYGISYDGTLNWNAGDNISDGATFGSGCSTVSSNFISVSVIMIDPPAGNPSQTFCALDMPTVSDLAVVGTDVDWYTDELSDTPLLPDVFLEDGEDYFATQTVGGCESGSRLQVLVILEDPQTPDGLITQEFCSIDNPTVSDLMANGINIQWYEEENSFSALAANVLLVDGEDYFATQTVAGCESSIRFEIYVSIADPLPPTGAVTQYFCTIDDPRVSDIVITGENVLWYEEENGLTPLDPNDVILDGEDYFATQTVNGCESDNRTQVVVAIDNPAAPFGDTEQSFCLIDNPTISDLEVVGQNIQWYDTPGSNSVLAPSVALLNGGDYFATQTVNGCESDTRFQVIVTIENPSAPIATSPQEFCAIDNPIVANLVGSGITMFWYESATSQTPLSNNASLVHGEDYYGSQMINGCESMDRVMLTVNVNDPISPSGDAAPVFCSIDNPTLADISLVGENILWYETVFSLTPIPATTPVLDGETYYATQTISGCESDTRFEVNVIVESPASPSGNGMQVFCEIDNPTVDDLNATGSGVLWYADAASTSPVAGNIPLVDGEDYFATQTVGGCESEERFIVAVEIETPVSPSGNTNQSFCSIDNPSIADLAATGSSIQWYIDATSMSPLPVTTLLTDGMEYFATQTANGCESVNRFSVVVEINDPQAPSGNTSHSFCSIDNPTISDLLINGSTIQWYSDNNTMTPLSNTTPLMDGEEYFATQTVNGCESDTRFSVTVEIADPTAPSGNSTQVFCSTDNPALADLTGSGSNIQWYSDNSTLIPLPNNTSLIDGEDYFATQTVNGCESDTRFSVMVEISEPPISSLIIATLEDALCGAGSTEIEISSSQNNVEYILQALPGNTDVGIPIQGTGGTILLPTGNLTETTTFQILATNTDNPDCQTVLNNTIEITVDDASIMADAGTNQILCGASTATLNANEPIIGAGNWSMVSGPSNVIFTDAGMHNTSVSGLVAGTYELQWEVENGACSGASSVKDIVRIEVVEMIATAQTTETTTVGGDDGIVGICVEGGTSPFTIQWSPDSGNVGSVVSADCDDYFEITGLAAGTYDIEIIDANGCSTVLGNIEIEEPDCSDFNIISVISAYETCPENNDATLTIEVENGIGELTYDIGNGVVPTMTNNSDYMFDNLESGTYMVTVTDERGCSTIHSQSVTILEPDTLKIELTTVNPSMIGVSDGIVCIAITGGTPPYNLTSTCGIPAAGPEACGGMYHIADLPDGVCSIMVTDNVGCSVSDIAVLSEPDCDAFEFIDVMGEDLVCGNDNSGSIFIAIQGGVAPYQYSIDDGNTFVTENAESHTFDGLAVGTYDIVVMDQAGCNLEWNSTLTLSQPEPIVTEFINAESTCPEAEQGSVDIIVTGGVPPYSLLWSNGESSESLSGLSSGNYTVTVTDDNGCSIIATHSVAEFPAFDVQILVDGESIDDRILFQEADVDLLVVTNALNPTYEWTPSDGLSTTDAAEVTATISETMTYSVVVTSEDGCTQTAMIELILYEDDIIVVPNTFSPNGDNNNDLFFPISTGNVQVLEFQVFNRWGQKIFDDPEGQWDGTFKGKLQPLDTYVYIVKYKR